MREAIGLRPGKLGTFMCAFALSAVIFYTAQRHGYSAADLKFWGDDTSALRASDEGDIYGQPVLRSLQSKADVYAEEYDCMSCTTCKGVPGPTVCADGVPDSTVPDPGAKYDPKAAQAWLDKLQCPFPRSMWIISTLTPNHPRAGYIVNRMQELTAHSTWGVLFVSTQQLDEDENGNPPPIINVLGRNIAVMNISLSLLRALPLETSKMLVKLLKDRAKGEWGRPEGLDPMITAQGGLHMSLKMIPYLVAIKCGVRAIFDTIDDDLPNYLPGLLKVNPDMVSGPFKPKERKYFALPPDLPEPELDDIPAKLTASACGVQDAGPR